MSYLVNDVMAEYTDRSTGNKQVRAFIVADTAADLPANSTVLTWLLGSYALTVDTGDTYYIDSSGSWILQPNQNAFSNVYTKTEIDDLLDQIDQLDQIATDALGRPLIRVFLGNGGLILSQDLAVGKLGKRLSHLLQGQDLFACLFRSAFLFVDLADQRLQFCLTFRQMGGNFLFRGHDICTSIQYYI